MARVLPLALVLEAGWSLTGCAGPEAAPRPEETLRTPFLATDLDPDPGIVEIELFARSAVAEFTDGVPTSVLAYADGASGVGTIPGPLIEATVGDRLIVHFHNDLPTLDTTVHWHGLRLPVDMDGSPMVSGVVAPGDTFEYDFTLRDAGLYWYHPHVDTDVQLELGLQGLLRVREAEPPDVDRERIFALDDVQLAEDGSVDVTLSADDAMLGRQGNTVTINGGPPGRLVGSPGGVERWRWVNTANGRYFVVEADGLSFVVIGGDGGLLPVSHETSSLTIAPGERYDVIVRLPEDRDTIAVRSASFERGMGHVDTAADLFEVQLVGPPSGTSMPEPSRAIEPLTDFDQTRRFEVSSRLDGPDPVFFINDERWPLSTPVEVVSGFVDQWEVVNEEEHHHPFHIHGLFFQVLDDVGEGSNQGWKDTIDIAPHSTVRLAVPYGEPGRWMFHCQIPEHAERGMTGDLVVLP